MKKTMEYSVLRYIPSQAAGEAINLGILFYDKPTGYCNFRHTQNYNRIIAFDREISKNNLEVLLEGIEQEVIKDNKREFDINKFIKYYINSFKFEKPRLIEYEDLNEIQDELFRLYLSQDA